MQAAANTPNQNDNAGASAKGDRPRRRDFYKTIVIRNNGAVVPENEWRGVATGSTAREVRKQLKSGGMQAVRMFDADAYKNARETFKTGQKTTAKAERDSVIVDAFKEADVEQHPRVAAALKTLLPLFREAPAKKTVITFRNIIRAVTGSVDLAAQAQPRGRGKPADDANKSADDKAGAAAVMH